MFHHSPNILFDDIEARNAIIRAILLASQDLWRRHKIVFDFGSKRCSKLVQGKIPPDLLSWKLFETLCILSILRNADRLDFKSAPNPFRKFGPLRFKENGKTRYLWYQPEIESKITGLKAKPDIVTTSDPTIRINSNEDISVIECKHHRVIGATLIRTEYGKARDLGVFSYLIWNWKPIKPSVVQSAKKLGLDLISIGKDSESRQAFLREPLNLLNYVQDGIAQSRKNSNFAVVMTRTGRETAKKMKLHK